ncbi:MAG TPA: PaaI family thioesterase [Candidatus Angelobacter sp.]|nr:PaaI family thioesterase [Candidatus Angelobacter sp.]
MAAQSAISMIGEGHYRRLERMYRAAPINEFFKPEIRIDKGTAEIIVHIDDRRFFHAANAIHGTVYFKSLDDAAFFAVSSLVGDCFVLTSNFNLYMHAPVAAGVVRSVGHVVRGSGSSFLAEAVMFNDQNDEIARGSGMFVKRKIRLAPEMGYR